MHLFICPYIRDLSLFKTFPGSWTGGQRGWASRSRQWTEMLVGPGSRILITQMRMSACRGEEAQGFPRAPPAMWLPKR